MTTQDHALSDEALEAMLQAACEDLAGGNYTAALRAAWSASPGPRMGEALEGGPRCVYLDAAEASLGTFVDGKCVIEWDEAQAVLDLLAMRRAAKALQLLEGKDQ